MNSALQFFFFFAQAQAAVEPLPQQLNCYQVTVYIRRKVERDAG